MVQKLHDCTRGGLVFCLQREVTTLRGLQLGGISVIAAGNGDSIRRDRFAVYSPPLARS
jgi:hypothetical protein